MKHLTNLDMVFNQILRLVLERRAANPTELPAGGLYYNTASNEVRWCDGSSWNVFGSTLTGTEILNNLLSVDGANSGLDADLLDGLHASELALAGHSHTGSQISDLTTIIDARIMAAFSNEAIDVTVDTIAEFTQVIRDNQDNIANILSAKRHDELFGDGAASQFPIVHGLNTVNPVIQIVEVATGEVVGAKKVIVDLNTVRIDTDITPVPSLNQYRAIIIA